MTRRQALVSQAEIRRALKAAREALAREVVIEGASIRIVLGNGDSGEKPPAKVAKKQKTLLLPRNGTPAPALSAPNSNPPRSRGLVCLAPAGPKGED